MSRILLPLLLVSLVACGPKKSDGAGASPAAGQDVEMPTDVPKDENSQAFARKLMKNQATNFKPTDASGASFVYKTLTFKPDMSWRAEAVMEADGETMDCAEMGSWTMDAADDEHSAMMTWKLGKTTCAGRPENNTMRVKVRIEKGEYTIQVR